MTKNKPAKVIGTFRTRAYEFTMCGDSRVHCAELLKEAFAFHVKTIPFPCVVEDWLQELINRPPEELQWEFEAWIEDPLSGDMLIDGDIINERS